MKKTALILILAVAVWSCEEKETPHTEDDALALAPLYILEASFNPNAFDDIEPFVAVDEFRGLSFRQRPMLTWSELRSEWAETYRGRKGFLLYDPAVHLIGPDSGWGTARFRGTFVGKDGQTQRLEGRATLVLKKRGNRWVVVHMHTSLEPPAEQPASAAAEAPGS